MKKAKRFILEYMRNNGVSQRDLAKKIGIAESMVSHIVHGRRNAGLRTIMKISKALGVPPERLI